MNFFNVIWLESDAVALSVDKQEMASILGSMLAISPLKLST
jgi:hypothetical protein